jgi:hypothetical protein
MKPFDASQGDRVVRSAAANGVPGEVISVRTDLGTRVAAWRPTGTLPANPQTCYFCHGYSLGTFRYLYSVASGEAMVRVLADEYLKIGTLGSDHEGSVASGDLLVWWKYKDPVHSAIVNVPVLTTVGGRLDPERTLVSSKTGTGVVRVRVPLSVVKRDYINASVAIEVYRKA